MKQPEVTIMDEQSGDELIVLMDQAEELARRGLVRFCVYHDEPTYHIQGRTTIEDIAERTTQ